MLNFPVPPIQATFSHGPTQTFAAINTPQAIQISRLDRGHGPLVLEGSGVIRLDAGGGYLFDVQPQVQNASGQSVVSFWPEIDLGDGNGFQSVDDAALALELENKDLRATPIFLSDRFKRGDRVRFMAQTDTLGVTLYGAPASGNVPAIPSVIVIVHRTP